MRKQSTHLNKDQLNVEKLGANKEIPHHESPKWATKELLEFVAHMKNGDTSVLSQFDVQTLLLEYIKRNNLRDPQKKCQIICDSRLILLFGKERVGHIEMLKLLEFHFLIKENAQRNNLFEGAVLDTCSGQVDADWISDYQPTMTSDKKRKKRKKGDEGGPNSNLDEYAAINVHNINLIFLRRTLMENLIDDADKFHNKVVGSIVRIRISNSDQKQDMYRLVQVVGTSKVAEPYKIGTKTTDVMLEIINLDKKEVISIDEISNQEFSEDECKCLRQYIKCGLIKRLSVGEIQEKAMKLQAVRVNDWLEAEKLRLSHLRDRASEKGLRKELRECVEKLQLLNSPEERQRRLLAIPEVHADPNMDPSHDSEDGRELDWKRSGSHMRLRSFSFGRKERESVSPLNTYPSNVDKDDGNSSWHPGSEALVLKSSSTSKNQVDSTGRTAGGKNDLAVVRSELSCGVASEISGPVPYAGPEQSANVMETDNLWNYQDPTGKIQGPFCLVQLRKWSITGHFPPDLKIWRLNGKQEDSILLIDALDGRYDAEKPSLSNNCLLSEEVKVTVVDSDDNKNGGLSGGFNTTQDNSKKKDSWDAKQNDENALSNGKEESERSKELGSPSCSSAPSLDVINSDEEKAASVLLGWDSMKGNSSRSVQPQVSCSLPSSIISSEDLSNQVRKDPISEGLNSSQDNGNCNSHETVDVRGDSGQSPEKQSNNQSNSGQSAAEDHKLNVEEWDSKVVSTSSVKPTEMANDHAATPTSMSELTHSSPAQPVPNTSSWQLLVSGPEEFFPLVDESVSDLLAEVEAMESLCGLSSGTSTINCGGELVQDSKNDCFDPADGFSPTRDLGKNDALSSTGDLQISLQCTVKDEPREISESDVRPIELLSKSTEVEVKPSGLFLASPMGTTPMAAAAAYTAWRGPETVQTTLTIRPSDVSVSEWEAGAAGIPPPPASTTIGSLGMVAPDSTWRVGPETTAAAASWASSEQGNPNLGWIGGLSLGNSNMGWTGTGTGTGPGTGTGTMLQHLNVNWGNSHAGNQGMWGNQPRHSGERYSSPRDRHLQSSGDFSYGNGNGNSSRGRSPWSRQVGGGSGGGSGGSFRSPPKGQRVCKFYESGCCKKGASCSYLHP